MLIIKHLKACLIVAEVQGKARLAEDLCVCTNRPHRASLVAQPCWPPGLTPPPSQCVTILGTHQEVAHSLSSSSAQQEAQWDLLPEANMWQDLGGAGLQLCSSALPEKFVRPFGSWSLRAAGS